MIKRFESSKWQQVLVFPLVMALVACTGEADAESGDAAAAVKSETIAQISTSSTDVPHAALGRIKNVRPDIEFGPLEDSEITGLIKTQIIDGPPIYVTPDGGHFIVGTVYEVGDNEIVDLEERAMESEREREMAALKTSDMIVFNAVGERKSAVYVFTDVDCYYCQKLHAEIAQINALGIEVRYLAYPRQGIGSEAYKKIASAWCAEDPNTALTDLKAGRNIEENVCTPNPVPSQYNLGGRIGVRGTPAMITEQGKLLPGYRPADALATALGI